jgi:hypothetical protein
MSDDIEEVKGGYIQESLGRSNKAIKAERGDAINEDLEMVYKREIEDKEVSIKRLTRKQINAFDFSPTNSQSLVMGKDFDAGEVMLEDLKSGLDIHNETVKLTIAKKRYNFLFGETYEL